MDCRTGLCGASNQPCTLKAHDKFILLLPLDDGPITCGNGRPGGASVIAASAAPSCRWAVATYRQAAKKSQSGPFCTHKKLRFIFKLYIYIYIYIYMCVCIIQVNPNSRYVDLTLDGIRWDIPLDKMDKIRCDRFENGLVLFRFFPKVLRRWPPPLRRCHWCCSSATTSQQQETPVGSAGLVLIKPISFQLSTMIFSVVRSQYPFSFSNLGHMDWSGITTSEHHLKLEYRWNLNLLFYSIAFGSFLY